MISLIVTLAIMAQEKPPPPPPPAEEMSGPAHQQHRGSVVVDINLDRIKELERQQNGIKASLDRIADAIDRFAVVQQMVAGAVLKDKDKPAQPKPKLKYSVQTIDGKWWYSDDLDDLKYAEWYYNRRARGIPIGAEPLDMPARTNQPARPVQVKVRKGVKTAMVDGADTPPAPPAPGATVAPAPPVTVYAAPPAATYAAPQLASSCYSSSFQQSNAYAYQAPTLALAPAYGGYGGGFSGGYGGGYGGGFGSQQSMSRGGVNLSYSNMSDRRGGLLGMLFGGGPRAMGLNMSLGGRMQNSFSAPFGGGGFGGCPGGVCPPY